MSTRTSPRKFQQRQSDRVIGLPSQTSNGLFAASNNQAYSPSKGPGGNAVQINSDHGFIAMTEASTMQAINEDLQRRMASLEFQREEAIARCAEVESAVGGCFCFSLLFVFTANQPGWTSTIMSPQLISPTRQTENACLPPSPPLYPTLLMLTCA